jgi:hypothetical protein
MLFCSEGETCTGGKCGGGVAKGCDDENPCTADLCDELVKQCRTTPLSNGTGCTDDGNPCTSDACASGVCAHPALPDGAPCSLAATCMATCTGGTCGGGTDCDDSDPCTVDACGAGGCTHVPGEDGVPCSDGDACNGDETCEDGACAAGPAPACDDGNPCTSDKCDPESGWL